MYLSTNQFIILAVAEKVAALTTAEYLEARVQRASRERFEQALTRVGDVKPPEQDRFTN